LNKKNKEMKNPMRCRKNGPGGTGNARGCPGRAPGKFCWNREKFKKKGGQKRVYLGVIPSQGQKRCRGRKDVRWSLKRKGGQK